MSDLVRSTVDASGGGRFRVKVLKRQMRFWLPSDRFTRMFFLERGHLTLLRASRSGRETALHTITAGEWFGEFCFCDEGRKPHPEIAARADEDCLIHEVESAKFFEHLNGNAAALKGFVRVVCRQLAEVDRRVEILARRGAEERICALLLELAETKGSPSQAGSKWRSVSVTHTEIAAMTAMNRPNVTVTLGALRRKGFIRYERNRPILVDCPKVNQYVDGLDEKD
ncbi:MAG TPA: Crp/Fnr family transcriptional regulator [Thermoanaerobaculia bacterium]|nr:Crp/Fnr family transcriptional regulator [Thermoanaerobaculia bacterium]